MPISRWRATAAREQQVGDVRARDHQDEAERKKERREQQHDVGRQRDRALPRFEHEVRAAARPLDGIVQPHAASPTRGAPRAPGRATDRASAARRCRCRRSLRVLHRRGGTGRGARAAPRSPARATVSPRKPSGITPTTWNGAPFTRTVRLRTPGSLAKYRDQARWLRTMTRRPPGSSSDGVSVRPRAALTPRTWKKFPVTSEPSILRPSIRLSMSGGRECIGEHARLADERVILRAREALGLRVGRSLTFDREQLVRVAHLVHAKDHRVEEREHDGHQPEAERHRRHDRQGHQGRPAERATRVQDVPHQAVDPPAAAFVEIHGVGRRH